MSKHRRAARVDSNQKEIVKTLRSIPGVKVEPGHDDILVGYRGVTYWFEIKSLDAISPKTGDVRRSEITDSEWKRLHEFTGHYQIIWTVEQALKTLDLLS